MSQAVALIVATVATGLVLYLVARLCGILRMASEILSWLFPLKMGSPTVSRPPSPQRKGANMRHMERFE